MAIRIRRREFVVTLGGVAIAWPLAARGQPSLVRPLIGLLSPLSAAAASRNVAAFRSSLRDLGYVEGRNLALALRYGATESPNACRRLPANWSVSILTSYSPARTPAPWPHTMQRGQFRSSRSSSFKGSDCAPGGRAIREQTAICSRTPCIQQRR
jgi:hypothetical protein